MAATSEIGICNLALGWLGANLIKDFDDGTTESDLCKVTYPNLRRAELEAIEWTFAQSRKTLAPLASIPVWGYATAFELPGDCLRVNFLGSSGNSDESDSFDEWVREGSQVLVNPAGTIAYLRYTRDVVDVSKFSDAFAHSLAARLAMDLATPLTHNPALQSAMSKLYEGKLGLALQADQKQGRSRVLRARGMLVARRGGGSGTIGPTV